MFALRFATLADLPEVFPRTRRLNDHEGIGISDARLENGLRTLLGSSEPGGFGGCWLVTRDAETIGYAIVTFGFDLEFGGREGWLTELWIDVDQRAHGAGTAALKLLEDELRARDVQALHLQVRKDNPAMRLYQRAGFKASPRVVMTRLL